MKINVTSVSEGWKAKPDSDPLFTISIDGQSEPQRTFDSILTVLGEHEAETYQSKTGKTYWRAVKDGTTAVATGSVLKTREDSIERQVALKEARQATQDYFSLCPDATVTEPRDYYDSVEVFYKEFVRILNGN